MRISSVIKRFASLPAVCRKAGQKTLSFYRAHRWLAEAALFAVAFALYWPLQANGVFPDPDSFYHLKMAELTASQGPIRFFPWMPFTTLAQNFADHHFLYHAALIPFLKVFGSVTGIKIATAVFAAATVAVISFVMRKLGLKLAPLFALLLAVTNPFVFRLNLAKASSFGIILLMIGIYFAVRLCPLPLFLVSFFYVWTHGGWPALLGLGTAAIIVAWWPGKGRLLEKRRVLLANLAALWGGAAAGLVINPFFPANLKFYWEQIVQIALVNYQTKIGVGSEWYPYAPADLVSALPLLFGLIAAAVILWPFADRKNARAGLAYSLGAFAFLVLTLRSRRHVEYFVPLATVAAALWLEPMLIRAARYVYAKSRLVPAVFLLGAIAMLAFFGGNQLAGDRTDLSKGYSVTLYKGEAGWLKENAPPGEIIVHADWDDFPPLFLYDDVHRYIMGLDPTFFYRANPELYSEYVDLTLGKSEDPVAVMEKLNSRYVVTDESHSALRSSLLKTKKFVEVYRDEDGYVYKMD